MCVANKPSKLFHTRRSTHRDRTRVRLVLLNLIPQECQVDERRTIIKREKLTTHSTCCESVTTRVSLTRFIAPWMLKNGLSNDVYGERALKPVIEQYVHYHERQIW